MTDHYAASVDLLESVHDARAHLQDVYALPAEERDARVVARLNAQLGDALKLADVHATLAVAQCLEDVRAAIEDVR